ncbi:MAG: LytR/AlgR family response regulator transcription factor [Chitinophagaceae bacterium]
MTCIIVEDEPLAQERLKEYVNNIPGLQLKAILDNGTDALAYLQKNKTDLVLLDIQMDGLTGIKLLEDHKLQCQVIMTTAYHEFAIKGYELNVTDYLLKPFSFERFSKAIEKAAEKLYKNDNTPVQDFFFVRTEYRLEKIFFSDLLYIEGMRDYRKIHINGKPIMTLQTFRDFEKEIPSTILCRVHKSFMIAIDKIESIEKNEIRIGEKMIPISDTYREAFYNIIHSKPS